MMASSKARKPEILERGDREKRMLEPRVSAALNDRFLLGTVATMLF